MGAKAGNLNSVIENQDSDWNLHLALWGHRDIVDGSRVQTCRGIKKASLVRDFEANHVFDVRVISSNSSAIENRFEHFLCFKKFASKIVSSTGMFSVIAIDFFHCVRDFRHRSKG